MTRTPLMDTSQGPLFQLRASRILILAFTATCCFCSAAHGNWMYLGMSGATMPLNPGIDAEMDLQRQYPDLDPSHLHHPQQVLPPPPSFTVPAASPPGPAAGISGLCSTVPGLVNRQRQVCLDHPDGIRAVSAGARRGFVECQLQFRNERWNCTTEGDDKRFDNTLQRGSRETAFIYAITSAGVVHAVTEACSAGNLTDCSCDRQQAGGNDGSVSGDGWKWGGCSDNVRYGIDFGRQFVDAEDRAERKRRGDVRTMMNLHNNQAGRLAIMQGMEKKCRCHGVSGSCEVKTCWRTLPKFSQVGAYLKRKYEQSVQVSLKAKKRLRRRGKVKRKVPVRKDDLVHIARSPNYCIEDAGQGILGTSGRECNKTAAGPESCNLLCCGRGYNTQVIRHRERCHCKFHWCCFVTCKVCETELEVYTCK